MIYFQSRNVKLLELGQYKVSGQIMMQRCEHLLVLGCTCISYLVFSSALHSAAVEPTQPPNQWVLLSTSTPMSTWHDAYLNTQTLIVKQYFLLFV
jgi:hypothetical protein